MRNAHQILDIVTAAFGAQFFDGQPEEQVCSNIQSEVQELACKWRGIQAAAQDLLASQDTDAKYAKWVSTTAEVRVMLPYGTLW